MSATSSCSAVSAIQPIIKEAFAKFQTYLEELRPDTLIALLSSGLVQLANFVEDLFKICSTNGILAEEIGDLEVLLNAALVKGRSYISACRDAAEFAADDEFVEAIKADVKGGGTNELRELFQVMEEHWQDSEKQLNEFNSSFEQAISEAKSKTKLYHEDAAKALDSRKTAVSGTIYSSGGILVGAVAMATTPATLGTSGILLGIVVVTGCVKLAAENVLDGINAQAVKGVAEQAEECAAGLHDQLSKAKQQVDSMRGAMTGVRSALDKLGSRLENDGSKLFIERQLTLLHKKMKEVAKIAEDSLRSLPPTLASIRDR